MLEAEWPNLRVKNSCGLCPTKPPYDYGFYLQEPHWVLTVKKAENPLGFHRKEGKSNQFEIFPECSSFQQWSALQGKQLYQSLIRPKGGSIKQLLSPLDFCPIYGKKSQRNTSVGHIHRTQCHWKRKTKINNIGMCFHLRKL